MVKVETIDSSANSAAGSSSRISAHTHISGLGLDENGDAIVPMMEDGQGSGGVNTSGLVGQVAAREALGIVSDLVHSQRLAGRALLLVGPPGRFGTTVLQMHVVSMIGLSLESRI
jgi:DNA helicase TIP49 (TBP-interacting protein)